MYDRACGSDLRPTDPALSFSDPQSILTSESELDDQCWFPSSLIHVA